MRRGQSVWGSCQNIIFKPSYSRSPISVRFVVPFIPSKGFFKLKFVIQFSQRLYWESSDRFELLWLFLILFNINYIALPLNLTYMKNLIVLSFFISIISSSIFGQYRINKNKYKASDYTYQAGDRYDPTIAGVACFLVD